jgi:hypothetical protein
MIGMLIRGGRHDGAEALSMKMIVSGVSWKFVGK